MDSYVEFSSIMLLFNYSNCATAAGVVHEKRRTNSSLTYIPSPSRPPCSSIFSLFFSCLESLRFTCSPAMLRAVSSSNPVLGAGGELPRVRVAINPCRCCSYTHWLQFRLQLGSHFFGFSFGFTVGFNFGYNFWYKFAHSFGDSSVCVSCSYGFG